MRAQPPPKTQDITIKVGYRLEPEDDEPLESRRIKASVKTSAGTFHGAAQADAPQGTVSIPIPGVKNLQELEVVSATVTIEDGNKMDGEGTVPRDPLMGFLESVAVKCEYLPESSSPGKDVFGVTATVYLARAVNGEVSGLVRVMGGKGKAVPVSFANGVTVASVALGEIVAAVGSAVEVEATLSKNGKGTVTGAATAEKLQERLNSFALDVVRKSNATGSGFATFEVLGQIQAEIPYKDGKANWTVAGKNGSVVVPKDSGMATFGTGAMPLKPGSSVAGSVELVGGGGLEATAVVPDDEVNSMSSVALTGAADDPRNLQGTYTLRLSLTGIAPRGEGAGVTLSGPVDVATARLEGHGGSLDLVVASSGRFPPGQAVVVSVSIEGGNTLEAKWPGPPPLPVVESEAESVSPEEAAAEPPPIPVPPPLPSSATADPDLEDEGNDGNEEERKREETLKAELVEPAKRGVREGIHWIRLSVTKDGGGPAVGSSVIVEIAEQENWLSGMGGRILTGQPLVVGAHGMVEFEYQTGEFSRLPEENSLIEKFLVYQEIENVPWEGEETDFR